MSFCLSINNKVFDSVHSKEKINSFPFLTVMGQRFDNFEKLIPEKRKYWESSLANYVTVLSITFH